jgi:hypothetical protein
MAEDTNLQSNIPQESTVKVESEPVKVEEKVEEEHFDPLTEPYVTNPFFYEVANYFGVEQGEYDRAKDKLSVIVDWAFEETQSKKPEDILLKIRELEDTLTAPDFGERRYSNVYKYVRLASRAQSFKKAMKALEKTK